MGNINVTYLPVLHRENQFFHNVLTCLQPWCCCSTGVPQTHMTSQENPMFKVDNYSHCSIAETAFACTFHLKQSLSRVATTKGCESTVWSVTVGIFYFDVLDR